nr:proximal tail sheath stabilization [uncultured Mediterranean phage uvMED]|tara:strand:- start:1755 stop:2552 length:798 start_codon:yes stop_codon:yes gene_type:complete
MLGTYSYNEIFRKTVIAFGTLFNNIEIKRTEGSRSEVMKVPLAYGPKDKFLARLKQVGDLTTKDAVQITLPRISFEISGFSYDATRKVSPTQVIRYTGSDSKTRKSFMPVPYNVDFELSIMAKNQDDGLQILEQILPFFQPMFNITLNLQEAIGEVKDFPVTLNSVVYEDDYEGDYTTRRTLIYTLSFSAKTYVYGPVNDITNKLIKKSIVDTALDSKTTAAREMRYTVQPDPLTADPDDNFGFNELYSEFSDGKSRNPVTGADE